MSYLSVVLLNLNASVSEAAMHNVAINMYTTGARGGQAWKTISLGEGYKGFLTADRTDFTDEDSNPRRSAKSAGKNSQSCSQCRYRNEINSIGMTEGESVASDDGKYTRRGCLGRVYVRRAEANRSSKCLSRMALS